MPADLLPPGPLTLDLAYRSDTEWRWVLADARGRFVADHNVALDPGDPLYAGFIDLPAYLRFHRPARTTQALLAELGDWIGDRVFGAVGTALLGARPNPACVVRVTVPPQAQVLIGCPFELARLEGQTLAERGIRLVYTPASNDGGGVSMGPAEVSGALRVLAVFSLPDGATPLNLRQERVALERLVRTYAAAHGRAVELRVLQYGATRDELEDVLQENPGWDLLHFSGHGLAGELVLEAPDGTPDRIGTDELLDLLQVTQGRLQLVTLSACYSGAADTAAARAALGLDAPPTRAARPRTLTADEPVGQVASAVAEGAGGAALGVVDVAVPAPTMLPSLGQRLAETLDCAVVAMRYPVLDRFAAELALALYDRLLLKGRPLPAALQLALNDAVAYDDGASEPRLSRVTPLLFGAHATALRLVAPKRQVVFALPTGLTHFPEPPPHFVGRLRPMLRARQALAPASKQTAVVFYGMAGAGKTACALELAHRYAPEHTRRFQGFAWYEAPKENVGAGSAATAEVAGALAEFAAALERQLPGLELVGLIDDPAAFRARALPQLRALMRDYAILLVLDNVEGLLTADSAWRDARWGELLAALTDHEGLGRVVITSRRVPATLAASVRVHREAIHALSLAESVVLARELTHLGPLFADAAGQGTLRQLLAAAEGHPKLLELADGLAADPTRLAEHLARIAPGAGEGPDGVVTSRFFETGESDRPEDAFVATLHAWTAAAVQTLSTTARLLAYTLARLEEEDRTQAMLESNWRDLLERLTGARGGEPAPEPARAWAQVALAEPGLGLDAARQALVEAALAEVTTVASEDPGLTAVDVQELLQLVAQQDPAVAAALQSHAGAPEAPSEGASGESLAAVGPAIEAALAAPSSALATWLAAQQRVTTRWTARVHPGVAEALRAAAQTPAGGREAADYWLAGFQQGQATESIGGGALIVVAARRAVPYLLRAERWPALSYAAEHLLNRNSSPSVVAFLLPVFRQVAQATRGTARELADAGKLAKALFLAGRPTEAEAAMRPLIARAAAAAEYRTASGVAGDLINVLSVMGRYEDALEVAREKAEYTRQGGFGPWTRLGDEGFRLQLLATLGRPAEVLEAVERLRPELATLPEQSAASEVMSPFNVRESLLDTGHTAALALERFASALELNADIIASKRRRGASTLELARTRYNAHSAMLRLGRRDECRALLMECRNVFEQEMAIAELGGVYSALADLEDEEGHPAVAANFERAALRYRYQVRSPEDCAISHNNLAVYLQLTGAPTAAAAHRLAAAFIRVQTGAGSIAKSVRILARTELRADPPAFADVVAEVEQVPGVRFGALLAALPARFPSPDATLAYLWALLEAERRRDTDQQAAVAQALTELPSAVRVAVETRDVPGLSAALDALAPVARQEAEAAIAAALGVDLEASEARSIHEALTQFESLLQTVAAAARGDTAAQAAVSQVLPDLEAHGWHLTEPVRRLWAGERDAAALTAGLDKQDSALLRRALDLVSGPSTN